MTDRVARYLDGTLERTGLDATERAQADTVQRVVQEARAFLDAREAPDVSAAVMARIEHLAPGPAASASPFARLTGALWDVRQVSFGFRPAYALLAAVALATAALLRPWPAPSSEPAAASNGAETRLFVQFQLQASDASTVRLAGSFTNWQPEYELHRSASGVWTITIPLSPGVHDYAFVVDGDRWMADPHAPAVADGFGGTNSRIALLRPEDAHL